MRNFLLVRTDDPSGVSGVGVVAEGTEFTAGHVALSFFRPVPDAISLFPSIQKMLEVHGHGNKTIVRYLYGHAEPDISVPTRATLQRLSNRRRSS